ncbi:MAG: hypothetical protein SFY95_11440 [Planctomycetota bacterium]|nr:hypothetical protein [Planctomycetota bacterium]
MHSPSRVWRIFGAACCVGFVLCAGACRSKNDSAGPAPSPTAEAPTPAAEPDRPWGGPDLTSNLTVPAGKRFIFAGGQPKGYTAYVTNTGTVPVALLAELDGVARPIVVLEPGQRASHVFAPREAALFDNPAATDAQSKVEIWGSASVGMRYIKVPG